MSQKRKTAADYRLEYLGLQKDLESLEERIADRLIDLCKRFPDAPIKKDIKFGGTVSAKSIVSSRNWILCQPVSTLLVYIEAIEDYLKSKEVYVQGKLFAEIETLGKNKK
jgi:hypothetical protein